MVGEYRILPPSLIRSVNAHKFGKNIAREKENARFSFLRKSL